MKNTLNQKTVALMLIAACGSLVQAQTPAPLAPAPVVTQWQFESNAKESAPDGAGNAQAKVAPGEFAAGWVAGNPIFGNAKGIWDLGKGGAITLSLPADVAADQARLITLRVIQYQDGAIYGELAKVSVPGATQVGATTVQEAATAIGEWVVEETQWRVAAGASTEAVVISGASGGTLVDQVSVASSTLPPAPQLSIERIGADKSQVKVTWTSAGSDLVLESNTNLNNPDGWTLVKEPAQSNGAVRSITTEAMGTPRFYRLKQPQP